MQRPGRSRAERKWPQLVLDGTITRRSIGQSPSFAHADDFLSTNTGTLRDGLCSARRSNVEADEHTLSVRQVANDLLDRLRQPSYEGWNRQYLVPAGELRVLEKVHDLDLVFSRKAPVTDPLEVRNDLD